MREFMGDKGGESPLPRGVEQFFTSMQTVASGTSLNLQESWQRPVRHNRKLERLALWQAVLLDEACERAVSDIELRPLLTLLPTHASADTRYDIQAATLTIPKLLPFPFIDRDKLRVPTGEYFEAWGEDMAQREPRLVADWHRWLWLGDSGSREPDADHGDASVLALAAKRLADGLRDVLWENPEVS